MKQLLTASIVYASIFGLQSAYAGGDHFLTKGNGGHALYVVHIFVDGGGKGQGGDRTKDTKGK